MALPVLLWWHFLSCVTLREKRDFRWGAGREPKENQNFHSWSRSRL